MSDELFSFLIFAGIFLAIILVTFILNYFRAKNNTQLILERVTKEYGKKPTRQYKDHELDSVKTFFYKYINEDSIDDITANDLDIDDIFLRINYARSGMGMDYLYYRLRNPISDPEELHKTDEKIAFFENNKEARDNFMKVFLSIGHQKSGNSFCDIMDYFKEIEGRSLFKDYLPLAIVATGIALSFFNVAIGIFVLIAGIIFGIVTYYGARGEIERSLVAFSYINRFIFNAGSFPHIDEGPIAENMTAIEDGYRKLKVFNKNSGLVLNESASTTGTGNPLEIIGDYLRMLFHIDIILFYHKLDFVKTHSADIELLYKKLGEIEYYISVAFYRASLEIKCVPTFGDKVSFKDIGHPLIDNPVTNSMTVDKCVLITGSNASGKSTFLKAVAINMIMAQTILTCTAAEFNTDIFRIFSSMSLRDSLEEKESYFMVEIKAIKRILDYSDKHPENRLVCFVDEVLRGTNTVERIAAGCQILKSFCQENVLAFAASHDVELTRLLEKEYDNYHFEEEIAGDDVLFNYKLQVGRANSRNAIKLLNVMGYSEKIVKNATAMAEKFVKTGEWSAE